MRNYNGIGAGAAAVFLLACWTIGGCGTGVIQIPVSIPLGSAGELDVEAGTPRTRVGTFTTGDIPIEIGSGSLRIDPSAITYDQTEAKVAQSAPTCAEACSAANVDAASCNAVCSLGQIEATLWIGMSDEVDTVCETGDQYGPYNATLDENGEVTSVDPGSLTFGEKTLEAFNAGGGSFCITVIAPYDGLVILDTIAGTVGL